MGIHIDEKESFKKKIDRFKDEIERRNKELQKERQRKKNS